MSDVEHRRHICDVDALDEVCLGDFCDECLEDWPCPASTGETGD